VTVGACAADKFCLGRAAWARVAGVIIACAPAEAVVRDLDVYTAGRQAASQAADDQSQIQIDKRNRDETRRDETRHTADAPG
jgi:hypothetical protein